MRHFSRPSKSNWRGCSINSLPQFVRTASGGYGLKSECRARFFTLSFVSFRRPQQRLDELYASFQTFSGRSVGHARQQRPTCLCWNQPESGRIFGSRMAGASGWNPSGGGMGARCQIDARWRPGVNATPLLLGDGLHTFILYGRQPASGYCFIEHRVVNDWLPIRFTALQPSGHAGFYLTKIWWWGLWRPDPTVNAASFS
jgi:hypothetical protein